ncbi:hypothetical protein QA601_16255 [Chitinispirillales bacterium ANBcel5]|uniref:hypothetical protein n=1 Tax=Cellulosispirillum alkaliphilum TaxID=3039283 RepID=UPI002A5312B7|nr:hypothetical protein [Chitinispirillales bacterium ANBcel5]
MEDIFKIRSGLIDIDSLYFKKSDELMVRSRESIRNDQVIVYGQEERCDLYLHIIVKNLFADSKKRGYVPAGSKIVIDFLGVHANVIENWDRVDENNLEQINEYVKHICTATVQLDGIEVKYDTENSRSKFPDPIKYERKVSGISESAVGFTLAGFPRATNCSNKHKIVFPLEFSEENSQKLFLPGHHNQVVFAWAWAINKESKDFYSNFNVDPESWQDREAFLKEPDKDAGILQNTLQWFGINTGGRIYSRNDVDSLDLDEKSAGGDNFQFDEPSLNCFVSRNGLPFSSFGIGRQIGPVGICKKGPDSAQYFRRSVLRPYSRNFTYLIDETPYLRITKDSNWQDVFDYEDGGEYHSRADDPFFFRSDSAAAFINTLERLPDQKYKYKQLQFPLSTIAVLQHDFCKRYSNLNLSFNSTSFIDYESIDLNKVKTVQIAGKQDIKDENGKLIATVERGIPGAGFLNTCHSKVFIKNNEYEAHTFTQRPLLINFELERDLSDEEVSELKEEPPKIEFAILGPNNRYIFFDYEPDIDFEFSREKGQHLCLVYLNTELPVFNATLVASNISLDNFRMSGKNFARSIPFEGQLSSEIVTYTPSPDGLFQGNPIISLDDYGTEKVRNKRLTDLRSELDRSIAKESGKFLLSFLPGNIADSAWEIAFDVWAGKETGNSNEQEIRMKALNLVLKAVGGMDGNGNFAPHISGGMKTLNFIIKIGTLIDQYRDKGMLHKSPFINGENFGDSLNFNDTLFLLSTTENKLTLNKEGITYSKKSNPDTLTILMNREVNLRDTKKVFHFQFGDTAGLLERSDRSRPDSLSSFRGEYQKKIFELKDALSIEDKTTVGDFLKALASTVRGRCLADIFEKVKVNKRMVDYTESNNISQLFERYLNENSIFTEDEVVKLTAFLNLIRYVDASFMICPACGHVVHLSWGWCPYHATRGMRFEGEYGGDDENERFHEHLLKKFGKVTVDEALKRDMRAKGSERHFVHWTEFEIKK